MQKVFITESAAGSTARGLKAEQSVNLLRSRHEDGPDRGYAARNRRGLFNKGV